jgi:beta-phosphoglucomutase
MKHIKVKAVLFDMDGVITHSMPYHFRAWQIIFKEMGFPVTRLDVYLREGQPGRLTIREICREQGRPFSSREADRLLAKKEKIFKEIQKPRFVPGARGFLKHLHQQGIRLALVTGTARHEVEHILPWALFDLFDVVVTGSEVKKGKPHPEPFLLALKKLGLLAGDAIVFENAPFGIRSAKAAGVRCLALETSLPKTYLKSADFVFKSFGELRRHLTLSRDPRND